MTNQEQIIDKAQQRRGRLTLVALLIFFVVPIITVVMMLKFDWKPAGQSSGHLIVPPHAINNPQTLMMDNTTPVLPLLWKEKWSVVYIAEECDATCYEKLKDMRQLHVSLYKNIMRTQRILITKSKDLTKIENDFPDMLILNHPDAAVDALMSQFVIDEKKPAQANRLYFVDSLGYLMMSYEPDIPLKGVRKDLVRLLKTSWAG